MIDFGELKKMIGRLHCGNKDGTVFLIKPDIAITALHNIRRHLAKNSIAIEVVFPNISPELITASLFLAQEEFDIAILKLPEAIDEDTPCLKLNSFRCNYEERWRSFGYPNHKSTAGQWIKGEVLDITSISPSMWDIDLSCDQFLGEGFYKGFSGAPVIIENFVKAVILKELKGSLGAISINKIRELLEKCDVDIYEIKPAIQTLSYSYSPSSPHALQPAISSPIETLDIEYLITQMSKSLAEQFSSMYEKWLEGQKVEPLNWISMIRSDEHQWLILEQNPELKANFLCFEASLELNIAGNIVRAKQLADEAHRLCHLDREIRLRALISYREHGPEKAIEYLANQEDIDSINLKAAFLLEMGQISECRQTLTTLNVYTEPNAETFRIKALSFLIEKKVAQARLEIQKAIERKPQWERSRFTEAMIYYFSALSSLTLPGLLPNRFVNWPEPVDWMLVKQDDESVESFRKAAKIFQKLIEEAKKEGKEFQSLQTWHLACLANDIERQTEAIDYCRQLLQEDLANYRIISWGLSRNFDIEIDSSIVVLEKLVTESSANIFHIIALAACYLAAQKPQKAVALLNETKPIFQKEQADGLWEFWSMQSLIVSSDFKTAIATTTDSKSIINSKYGQAIALQIQARKTDDWQKLFQHLDESFKETGDSHFLLEFCRLKAQRQDWNDIADRAEKLVQEIGTSEVLRLTTFAAFNAKKFELCLKLLDEFQNLFAQNQFPTVFATLN